jgi:uncharacterized protein (TIGR02145 family)
MYNGYEYQTVQIGEQCWFAENLRTNKYSSGDPILLAVNDEMMTDFEVGAACIYGQTGFTTQDGTETPQSNFERAGYLYNGHAATDDRGLCPSGWHVPSVVDWGVLDNCAGNRSTLTYLDLERLQEFFDEEFENVPDASLQDWFHGMWSESDAVANNATGFDGELFGLFFSSTYSSNSGFSSWGEGAYMWSTTDGSNGRLNAFILEGLWIETDEYEINDLEKNYAASVRCVLDELQEPIDCVTYGCTDPDATNFQPSANLDDHSCEYPCGTSVTHYGHTYGTVEIGGQCWFNENLRTEFNLEGGLLRKAENYGWGPSGIFYGIDTILSYRATSGIYGDTGMGAGNLDLEYNLENFGRLYNGVAVNSADLCPSGWHVSTYQEVQALLNAAGIPAQDVFFEIDEETVAESWLYFDVNDTIFQRLTTMGFWELCPWQEPLEDAVPDITSLGFDLSPAGFTENGEYGGQHCAASLVMPSPESLLASSTGIESITQIGLIMDPDQLYFYYVPYSEEVSGSVRCVRDCDGTNNCVTFGCTDSDADNFNPLANVDDGTCQILGCTDSSAVNFSSTATTDDGSCNFAYPCGEPMNYMGHNYSTVDIGGKCWFKENLKTEVYANGDSIPYLGSASDWSSTTEGGRCVFLDEGSQFSYDWCDSGEYLYCDTNMLNLTGYLYNGWAVTDERHLCPSGWHVSSDEDWTSLMLEAGMDSLFINFADYPIEVNGILDADYFESAFQWPLFPGCALSDGPAALRFGGQRYSTGESYPWENRGYFWTNTGSVQGLIWREIAVQSPCQPTVRRRLSSGNPNAGMSVRCVKN